MSDTNETSSSAATDVSGVKVFVGNLAFAKTEEELKANFVEAGEVLSAKIITRGPRSLGYGFVELADTATAEKAVALFDKKELDGRTINVELAKMRDDTDGEGKKRPERRRRRRNNKSGAAAANRAPRQARVPSDTQLFVGNLPVGLGDDALLAAFADVNAKTARIVRKPSGASKRFGFLEFADNAAQLAALEAATDRTIEDCVVTLKVAEVDPPADASAPADAASVEVAA